MRTAIIDDLAICREEIKDYLCRYLEEYYGGEVPVIEEFERTMEPAQLAKVRNAALSAWSRVKSCCGTFYGAARMTTM